MAKGKKTGGRDFKPGHSGNPLGRPKLPENVKTIRKIDSAILLAALNAILFSDMESLLSYEADRQCSVIERMIIAIIKRAIANGDAKALELVTKLYGCYPEKNSSGLVYINPTCLKYVKNDGSLDLHTAIFEATEDIGDI